LCLPQQLLPQTKTKILFPIKSASAIREWLPVISSMVFCVRGWIGDRVGLEASGFYGRSSMEIEEGGEGKYETKGDLWTIEAKAMYAFIVRNYSKFYAGGKIGYGQIDTSGGYEGIDGTSFWTPGLFIGSEWSFPQLPEVGFNFDIGYSWLIYDNHVNDDPYMYVNLNLSGISASFGIHYYF
jgi:hypothetical protein